MNYEDRTILINKNNNKIRNKEIMINGTFSSAASTHLWLMKERSFCNCVQVFHPSPNEKFKPPMMLHYSKTR